MPAIPQTIAAAIRMRMKLRWMPCSVAATPCTPTWTLALKKKSEPNQPSE